MTKQTIRCGKGQRILDIYTGSRVKIEVKCSNSKCKHKSKCSKLIEFSVGYSNEENNGIYIARNCTICGSRVFDATKDSCGKVEIKCHKCRNVVDILIGDVESTAIAA